MTQRPTADWIRETSARQAAGFRLFWSIWVRLKDVRNKAPDTTDSGLPLAFGLGVVAEKPDGAQARQGPQIC